MDPILKIANYLFKKHNIDITVDSFDSFFDDGIAFPKFVALVFNVEAIPNINKNPKTIYHRQVNNSIAEQFLFKNNSDIAKISPTFHTERDKSNLIALILTKQCFKINYQSIISKCNLIVRSLGIHFTKKSDILDKRCILALLNVLTDGDVKIDEDADNFDDLMAKSFEKAKIPLVINKSSLEIQNQFTFFIQIEIIFDIYSKKIEQLTESNFQTETSESETPDFSEKSEKSEESIQKVEKTDISKVNYFCDSDDDDVCIEKVNDLALLNAINAIGQSELNFHFTTIGEMIENDSLPKFVSALLKERSDIEAITIIIEKSESQAEKISEVIKYLGEVRVPSEPLFSVLRFDFTDPQFAIWSAKLFLTNFLNVFFLKGSKRSLFYRCSTIIFGNINQEDSFYLIYIKNLDKKKNPYNDRNLLLKWDTYLALIHFLNTNNTHYQIDRAKKDDFYFKQNGIPQIIDEKYLKKFPKKVPDIVYYQLQFIFNVLDSKGPDYRLHELFLKTERKFKRINVPPLKKLNENIQFLFSSNRSKVEVDPPEIFWNPVDKSSFMINGVLCKLKNDRKALKLWFNKIINFHNTVNINTGEIKTLFTTVTKESTKSKLYKFFIYDESTKKWRINSPCIDEFTADKQFNSKMPLVLFSNAYEKDLIKINSKLINDIYPDLDDDNIYVYALCDKTLDLLHYNVDLDNVDNDCSEKLVKPIFLLLHVPKNMKKCEDIRTILFKIYYFLSIICDIEIAVLNREHCLEQLELIRDVNNVKRSYEFSASEILHKKIKKLNETKKKNEMNIAFEKADFNLWNKKSKYIVLLNDDTITGDIIKPDESDFVNFIKKKIDSEFVNVHHMNANDPLTYRAFLMSLNKFASNADAMFSQTFVNLNLFHMTDICSMYINLKSNDEWRCDLKNIIEKRFIQLLDSDDSDGFDLLDKLENEIVQNCPDIDSVFYSECFSSLNKIRHLIKVKNQM